jgi:hypothetical protein
VGKPTHTIILDWDGTAVPADWPNKPTTFLPGFVEAVRAFHAAGHHQKIDSARLNRQDAFTGLVRDPSVVEIERRYIRDVLDNMGLTYVDIWMGHGKPSGSVYIDDKGERYQGRSGSWRRLTSKVLTRLGSEDPLFPVHFYEEDAA